VSAAYCWITSFWLCGEYCWCSVDIRTYCAARDGRGQPGMLERAPYLHQLKSGETPGQAGSIHQLKTASIARVSSSPFSRQTDQTKFEFVCHPRVRRPLERHPRRLNGFAANSLFFPVRSFAEIDPTARIGREIRKLFENERLEVAEFPENIPVCGNITQRGVRCRLRPPPPSLRFLFSARLSE
jgi:hypothetical protein